MIKACTAANLHSYWLTEAVFSSVDSVWYTFCRFIFDLLYLETGHQAGFEFYYKEVIFNPEYRGVFRDLAHYCWFHYVQ